MRYRLFIVLLLLLLLVGALDAQDRSLVWQRWDVTISDVDVTANRFTVSEQYEIYFQGTFRFGQAELLLDNMESITGISVYENGRPLTSSCDGSAGTYCVSGTGRAINVRYNFTAPVTDASRRFELRYTVNGALRIYEGGDQLWWIAVTEDKFGFNVQQSTITVLLPEGYGPREGIDPVVTYGAPGEIQVNGERVVATATQGVGANESFEIRVQFPHNPDAVAPAWQAGFDTQRAFEEGVQPLLNIFFLVLGLLLIILGPVGVYYLWYSRGRDPKIGPVPQFLSEPPSDLPPALVGTLIDENAELRDILSTLIDLANRGHVVIEEDKKELFFGFGGSSEYTFVRTKIDDSDLRGFEKEFLRRFFGKYDERTLDSLKHKFYTHIPKLQDDLYDEMLNAGFFADNPKAVRSRWSALGAVLFFGSVAVGFMVFLELSSLSPALACIPVSLAVTGGALMVTGNFMPRKTQKGAEEAAKWLAFKEYLSNLQQYDSLESAAERFEQYMPYAVAFGLQRSWIRRFASLDDVYVPIPTWYYPRHIGRTYRRGSGAPTPMGMPGGGGDVVTAAGGGLNEMAGGLTTGLNDLADGLTSMLNSAASTLNSRPQSSSSGSWSSGGSSFSGGGSFGGGGSGGGSRGFG